MYQHPNSCNFFFLFRVFFTSGWWDTRVEALARNTCICDIGFETPLSSCVYLSPCLFYRVLPCCMLSVQCSSILLSYLAHLTPPFIISELWTQGTAL